MTEAIDTWVTVYGPLGNVSKPLGDFSKEELAAMVLGRIDWKLYGSEHTVGTLAKARRD